MSSSSSSVGCLLPAENLRCVPLSLVQMHALTIPPVIELFFCVLLVSMTWKSRRAHLLLAADGVLYFILALVDLLSHAIPAVTASKAAELFLGSVSFVPILLYTSYLVWLSRREFITYLPRSHQPPVKYMFIGLIPVVVTLNFRGIARNIYSEFIFVTRPVHDRLHQQERRAMAKSRPAVTRTQRIETKHTDEHHFFNGTGWISIGIKLGAIESIVGFTAGGFAVPLTRRILRLIGRVCMIIGALKGMDENENFELLNKELVLWRRGKPLSASHSLIANRHMSIRSSQLSDLSRDSSVIEKDVERGTKDQRVTVHGEDGEPPVLHIRLPALPTPKQVIHADDSRRQSGQNTSAAVLASRNVARLSKSSTLRQSAQAIFDDMSFVLELTPDLPPGVTGEYPESMLSQGHEDDKYELPALGIPRQQSTRHDTAQPYGEETATAECAVFYASEFMERKPTLPLLSIPQSAHAGVERPVSPWTRLASQHNGGYPVQFPVAPIRTGITIYSPTAQLDGESWDSPQRRHKQLSSLHLFERASKAHSDVHSSQWSTIARSQSPASIKMYSGRTVISPRRASVDFDDLVSPSSAETLRDGRPLIIIDQEHVLSMDGAIHESEIQRQKTLRRLNGEVSA
ncbi:hypothetical protein EDB19DRAFT_1917312 [Suillus lakei]|nr:hypothetical protein EDB19DRAFT_1917312 [Suillus lakei]